VTRPVTQPLYLDVHLPAGQTFAQTLTAGHNAFLYVYRGAVTVGDADGAVVEAQRMGCSTTPPVPTGS
jgi:redox-sensitive bicupin YhaK (pirin superfamily)